MGGGGVRYPWGNISSDVAFPHHPGGLRRILTFFYFFFFRLSFLSPGPYTGLMKFCSLHALPPREVNQSLPPFSFPLFSFIWVHLLTLSFVLSFPAIFISFFFSSFWFHFGVLSTFFHFRQLSFPLFSSFFCCSFSFFRFLRFFLSFFSFLFFFLWLHFLGLTFVLSLSAIFILVFLL